MTLFVIVLVVFALCILGMAVGLILRNRGFTTCGRAAASIRDGEGDGCSVCGAGADGTCRKETKKA